MASRTITGTVITAPRATIRFRQMAAFVTDSATYLAGTHGAATDAVGAFSIALPVPDDGTIPYRIELPDGTAADLFIGAGAATTLEILLAGAFASHVAQNVVQTAIDAEAAARIAADDARPTLIAADARYGQLAIANSWTQPQTIGTTITPGGYTIPSTAIGKGSFSLQTSKINFAGTEDPIMMLGYNLDATGGRVVAGLPGIATGYEGDYNDGTRRLIEWYVHLLPATGSTFYRPIAFSIDKDDPTAYLSGQIMVSGATGSFTVLRASDSVALLTITPAGSGTLTTSGQMSVGGLLTSLNSGGVAYRATGDPSYRFLTGISPSGGFQFASTDTVTPRTFGIVSSGGASKFIVGFETGDTTIVGNTTIQGTGLSSVAGRFQVNGRVGIGRDANSAFVLDAYNGITNIGGAGPDGTFNEIMRYTIASLPTQYSHQLLSTNSGGGLTLNALKWSLCDNTSGGHVDVLTLRADQRVGIGSGATSPAATLHAVLNTTTTNAVVEVQRIEARVSTAATGSSANFGPAQTFYGESATDATYRQMAQWDATWPTATDASRKARITGTVYDTAAREWIRGEASGTAPMIGFLGAAASARTAITGSRGGNAALANLLTELATKGLITDSTSA